MTYCPGPCSRRSALAPTSCRHPSDQGVEVERLGLVARGEIRLTSQWPVVVTQETPKLLALGSGVIASRSGGPRFAARS